MIGKRIGRYVILGELGAGGMATVYRARDEELGRQVAIKMLHPHLAKRPEYAERFRREARAVAALRHRHIIEIHDFASLEQEGVSLTYMVSELVEGPALSSVLESHPRSLAEVTALVGAHLADALSCAHEAGIVHRDVKPENVLVAPGGRVLLTDFGIARMLEGETVTATGALLGSPSYMSPEQARGDRAREPSDLFSLGVVLYRMATGRLPFAGRDPLVVITSIMKGEFTPALQAAPEVGSPFDRILRRCLATEPADRWESAEALSEALLELAAEGGLTDPDAELARFFDDPDAYEAVARRRVVTVLLERAEAAAEQGAVARALAHCDRALGLEPESEQARALLSTVGRARRGRRARLLLRVALLLALLIAGGVWWVASRRGGAPDRGARVASVPASVKGEDAGTGGDASSGADARIALLKDASRLAARGVQDAASPRRAGPGSRHPSAHAGARRRRGRPRRLADAGVGGRRGRDAGVAAASLAPDARVSVRPRSRPATGWLMVRVMPFCDVSLDGHPAGRSPFRRPLKVSAGWHRVRCVHRPSGQIFSRRVLVRGGERVPIRGSVLGRTRATVRLTRGDAIRLGSVRYRSGVHILVPGRFRYQLLKRDGVVSTGWITIPPGRCTLVDTPSPACR